VLYRQILLEGLLAKKKRRIRRSFQVDDRIIYLTFVTFRSIHGDMMRDKINHIIIIITIQTTCTIYFIRSLTFFFSANTIALYLFNRRRLSSLSHSLYIDD